MLRVEPRLKDTYVTAGVVKLAYHPALDHGEDSVMASMAVECAGEQQAEHYWTMHDFLFGNLRSLRNADISRYSGFAGTVGLDQTAFEACMAEDRYRDKVRNLNTVRRSEWGARVRPSFMINGQLYAGGIPFTAFEQAIQDALAQ